MKLGEALAELGSDAEVIIVPDRDHSNLLTSDLFAKMRRQMSAAFREHHK